ncbi:FdtA/QdtA family cupin domain-containing protein [Clostridium sp. NSJ-6]|uniref:FdtA/QdtA family cupin domain-containing protein n=1 Tax=Clostridium hominis TaxID=2763036 RepID=A0ABR7DAX3_9CLOT|nr:FdtA/QdtA family cupin domain-containing protein [Clostridium hominis]MBC5628545.1 FdtA/QdtA family cupin domain-containing protein [Clostridium hominis]MDU2672294.1 FdtA/QdtA family cupin domain-containing protein [Clostridium sp.]
MYNVALIKFKNISSECGHLIPIEGKIDIPYEIKRIFYIYGVPKDKKRGNHSHRSLYEILICLKGSLKVKVQNGREEEVYVLNNEYEGLMIGPWIWNEMFDYSDDCVLLVLCSDKYDESEYLRDYDVFLKEVNEIYKENKLC